MPDRIQREVEDLLAKLDTFPPKRSAMQKARSGVGGAFRSIADLFSGMTLPRLSAGHLLLIAIAVIVGAWFIGGENSGIVRWVIAGGIIAFIVAFALSLRRTGTGRPPEKYWRDKPLDLREPGGGGRLRSWWNRRSPRR